jgi:hypothetical protein
MLENGGDGISVRAEIPTTGWKFKGLGGFEFTLQ